MHCSGSFGGFSLAKREYGLVPVERWCRALISLKRSIQIEQTHIAMTARGFAMNTFNSNSIVGPGVYFSNLEQSVQRCYYHEVGFSFDFRELGYLFRERRSNFAADAAVDKVRKVKEAVFELDEISDSCLIRPAGGGGALGLLRIQSKYTVVIDLKESGTSTLLVREALFSVKVTFYCQSEHRPASPSIPQIFIQGTSPVRVLSLALGSWRLQFVVIDRAIIVKLGILRPCSGPKLSADHPVDYYRIRDTAF